MKRQQLAYSLSVTDRTVFRKLKDVNDNPDLLQQLGLQEPFPFAPGDELPENVVRYVLEGKVSPERPKPAEFAILSARNGGADPAEQKNVLKPADPEPPAEPQENRRLNGHSVSLSDNDSTLVQKKTDKSDTPPVQAPEFLTLSDKIFRGDEFALVMLAILVTADSFSCGWIAHKSFSGFWVPTLFFSLVGFAVAFSSIRNAIMYNGWESDTWLWGFGILQLLLHACAFELLDLDTYQDISSAAGKWVVCILIPAGTTGIAITWKIRSK